MATTADFRNGLCIQHNGYPWKIESFQHVKPGKGPAFVRTKIRNLNTGRLLENTFTSGVKIEVIRIENRKYQFLYAEGNDYHLMNLDDYEQIMLQKEFIENVEFLKEGENVNVLFHADKGLPLSADLPAHVTLEITKTEPGVKGNTATNTFKPATTESGADIQVPLFINEGDKIKIDTVKGAYLERVKG
jgi:elongation factor P|tara:strand:+ start:22 stop:588 length:567 start_codon:yes stop_codon:yes gene_type:complete